MDVPRIDSPQESISPPLNKADHEAKDTTPGNSYISVPPEVQEKLYVNRV